MINKFQVRVSVESGAGAKKQHLIERILTPEQSQEFDLSIVVPALRQLFPHSSTVKVEAYGI